MFNGSNKLYSFCIIVIWKFGQKGCANPLSHDSFLNQLMGSYQIVRPATRSVEIMGSGPSRPIKL